VTHDPSDSQSSTHNTIANTSVQTTTELDVDDERITDGAAGTVISGQAAGQTVATGPVSVVSNGVVYGPSGTEANSHTVQSHGGPSGADNTPRQTVVVGAALGAGAVSTAPVPSATPSVPAALPTVLSGQDATAQTATTVQAGQLSRGAAGTTLAGQTAGAQTSANGQTFFSVLATTTPISTAAVNIDVGSTQLTSQPLSAEAVRVQAALLVAAGAAAGNTGSASNQPIVFVPAAASGSGVVSQPTREVTLGMVAAAESGLFGAGSGPAALMALAMGAGASVVTQVQAGDLGTPMDSQVNPVLYDPANSTGIFGANGQAAVDASGVGATLRLSGQAMPVGYKPASTKMLEAGTCKAAATRTMLRSVMFFSPRSTAPMYVRCKPASNDNCSCDQPTASRRARSARPMRFSGARRFSTPPLKCFAAYKSTVYK